GHRRVIGWKPVGRTEAVGDLLPREGERAARKRLHRRVGRRRGSWRRARSRGGRDGGRPRRRIAGGPGCDRNQSHGADDNEGKHSAHMSPLCGSRDNIVYRLLVLKSRKTPPPGFRPNSHGPAGSVLVTGLHPDSIWPTPTNSTTVRQLLAFSL